MRRSEGIEKSEEIGRRDGVEVDDPVAVVRAGDATARHPIRQAADVAECCELGRQLCIHRAQDLGERLLAFPVHCDVDVLVAGEELFDITWELRCARPPMDRQARRVGLLDERGEGEVAVDVPHVVGEHEDRRFVGPLSEVLLVGQEFGDEVVPVRQHSAFVLAGVGNEQRQGERGYAEIGVDRDDRRAMTRALRHLAVVGLGCARHPLLHDHAGRRVRSARIQLKRCELSFVDHPQGAGCEERADQLIERDLIELRHDLAVRVPCGADRPRHTERCSPRAHRPATSGREAHPRGRTTRTRRPQR